MGTHVGQSGDPFFEKYKNHSLIWESIPGTAMMISLSIIGAIGNTNIVIATYKNRTLRSPCNYLLSMACVADIIHQLAHYTLGFVMFTGLNFIPLRRCLYLQTIPIIGLNFGLFLTMMIGFDRLMSVWFSIRYRQLDVKLYLATILLGCAIFTGTCLYKAYSVLNENPNGMVTCLIVDAMPGYAGDFWFRSCVTINLITIFSYLAVWISLRSMTMKLEKSAHRIFKSLTVIMFTLFFGWFMNAAVRIVAAKVGLDQVTFYHVGIYGGVFVNLACASNAFILYAFSTDYRRQIRSQLNLFTNKVAGTSVFSDSHNVSFIQTTTMRRSVNIDF